MQDTLKQFDDAVEKWLNNHNSIMAVLEEESKQSVQTTALEQIKLKEEEKTITLKMFQEIREILAKQLDSSSKDDIV